MAALRSTERRAGWSGTCSGSVHAHGIAPTESAATLYSPISGV